MSSPEGSPIPTPPQQQNHQRIRSSSDGEHSEPERPERMRDWLVRMVSSSRFPGLEWLDEEKTIFKVPWIHAKKRGYCRERDAALFREWAVHSGKFRDEADPTVWKINFRCAINGLKDIIELKDMQTEDCRVYKVLPSRGPKRRARRRFPSTEPYPVNFAMTAEAAPHLYPAGASPGHYGLPTCTAADTMFLGPQYSHAGQYSPPGHYSLAGQYSPACQFSQTSMKQEMHRLSCSLAVAPTSNYGCITSSEMAMPMHSNQVVADLSVSCIPSTGLSIPDGHISEVSYFDSVPLPPVSTIHSRVPEVSIPIRRQDSPDSGIEGQNSPPPSIATETQQSMPPITTCAIGMPTTSLPVSSSNPMFNSTSNDIIQIIENLQETHSPITPLSAGPRLNEIEVRILYGTLTVHIEKLTCSTNGCRIFFGQPYAHCAEMFEGSRVRQLFGPPEAHQIELPGCHPNVMASDIFRAMSRGLLIEVIDGDVYATPLCRTVVYHSASSSAQSFPLEKERRTKVFDYLFGFRPALEHYALVAGEPPNPYVVFGLGQSWGPGRHVAQNLVSIVVTSMRAKHELDTVGLPHVVARDLLVDIPEAIEIGKANDRDMEAEAFLYNHCISVN